MGEEERFVYKCYYKLFSYDSLYPTRCEVTVGLYSAVLARIVSKCPHACAQNQLAMRIWVECVTFQKMVAREVDDSLKVVFMLTLCHTLQKCCCTHVGSSGKCTTFGASYTDPATYLKGPSNIVSIK
ncbi:hypothetical protein KY289_029806 [Solanum tuberosum]|nr:hypothetical protein KY289_029806 [Solanum tuberosum]